MTRRCAASAQRDRREGRGRRAPVAGAERDEYDEKLDEELKQLDDE